MRLMRVDTGYRHALGDRYKYHLLILWRQLVRLAAIAGQLLRIDIKGFQCFDHCLINYI